MIDLQRLCSVYRFEVQGLKITKHVVNDLYPKNTRTSLSISRSAKVIWAFLRNLSEIHDFWEYSYLVFPKVISGSANIVRGFWIIYENSWLLEILIITFNHLRRCSSRIFEKFMIFPNIWNSSFTSRSAKKVREFVKNLCEIHILLG